MKYYFVSTWENVMEDGTWRRQFNFAIKENELSLIRINDTTKIEEISYKRYLFMVGFRWSGQFKEYLSFIENSTF